MDIAIIIIIIAIRKESFLILILTKKVLDFMKRLILSLFLLAISFCVKAQFSYGVEAGVMMKNFVSSFGHDDIKPSFMLGGVIDYEFGKIKVESGISIYENRSYYNGLKYELNGVRHTGIELQSVYYMDIPLLVAVPINLGRGLSIIPKAGAYLSCGLNNFMGGTGSLLLSYTYRNDNGIENDMCTAVSPWKDSYYDLFPSGTNKSLHYKCMGRFDYGLKLGLEVRSGHLATRFNYNHGLRNLYSHYDPDRFGYVSYTFTAVYYF